jgi:hypothetical protein
MTHITSKLTLALAVAFAVAGTSTAQARTQHHYTSVIQNATLSTADGYPGVGGTAVLAGIWTTQLYGKGALVDHVTITGNPTPSTISFKGTEVDFVAGGSFKASFTGTSAVQSDGSQKISTKGRFTGGTGLYKGAKGSFKFTGTTDPGGSVVTGRSAGTISY